MALSKPAVSGPKEKAVKIQKLDKNEILHFMEFNVKDTISMDVILGYLAGPDTTYNVCFYE